MQFEDLDLNYDILDALDDMNFVDCTPIQEHAIPPILDGRDIIGVAQTGTGKTAAYLLPILSMLRDGGFPDDAINCVIMAPTRELAQQIDQAMQGFAYYLDGISSVAIYGGNDGIRYEQEKRGLAQGASVIICTPGRLISHLSLGNVDLSRTSFFVLDEADRMLDMGFSEDIMQIASFLPKQRQTIMFSATMPDKIVELAKTILTDPVEVKLAVSKPADGIRQRAFICYEAQKLRIVEHIFTQQEPKRVIIFVGSKLKVKDVAIALKRKGYNAEAMHSDLLQEQRDDVMYRFKVGQLDILVATDIVARGIDIDDIQLVINYDVPHDEEDYVHRIGRTARAGKEGRSITLVSEKDQPQFRDIERFLEKEVPKEEMPAELGDTPAYSGAAPRRGKGHNRGRERSRGRGRGRNKGAQAPATKDSTQAPTTKEDTQAPATKRSRNRKRRKATQASETATNTATNTAATTAESAATTATPSTAPSTSECPVAGDSVAGPTPAGPTPAAPSSSSSPSPKTRRNRGGRNRHRGGTDSPTPDQPTIN